MISMAYNTFLTCIDCASPSFLQRMLAAPNFNRRRKFLRVSLPGRFRASHADDNLEKINGTQAIVDAAEHFLWSIRWTTSSNCVSLAFPQPPSDSDQS
jgi:hypothetical protein